MLVSQINYTQTHFAAHSQQLSHDQVNRYLRGKRISSRQVWNRVAKTITQTMDICCDDTGADKRYSFQIKPAHRQWSNNTKQVIITCAYVDPDIDDFWIMDYPIYDPQRNPDFEKCGLC